MTKRGKGKRDWWGEFLQGIAEGRRCRGESPLQDDGHLLGVFPHPLLPENIEKRFESGISCANLTPRPSPLAERGVEG